MSAEGAMALKWDQVVVIVFEEISYVLVAFAIKVGFPLSILQAQQEAFKASDVFFCI